MVCVQNLWLLEKENLNYTLYTILEEEEGTINLIKREIQLILEFHINMWYLYLIDGDLY